jgi:hypothetical protein
VLPALSQVCHRSLHLVCHAYRGQSVSQMWHIIKVTSIAVVSGIFGLHFKPLYLIPFLMNLDLCWDIQQPVTVVGWGQLSSQSLCGNTCDDIIPQFPDTMNMQRSLASDNFGVSGVICECQIVVNA